MYSVYSNHSLTIAQPNTLFFGIALMATYNEQQSIILKQESIHVLYITLHTVRVCNITVCVCV